MVKNVNTEIEILFESQLAEWETARNNYEALKQVKIKELNVDGAVFQVQFNPARIVSSAAKVDTKSIQERQCFLCAINRPSVQKSVRFDENYTILINPFPIFPKHFTIPDNLHQLQLIAGRFGGMLALAEAMTEYVIFYNGPKCGASAPDHIHFQAGNKGFLPLEVNWRKYITETLTENTGSKLYSIDCTFPALVIETDNKNDGEMLFEKIYNALNINEGELEPMLNILTWFENEKWIAVIIPRVKHRPDCFFATDEENILISPASVDLGGVFITPLQKDFEKIEAKDIEHILREVCMSRHQFEELTKRIIYK